MRLDGIHHITCITGDAPRNVDFYTGVLGLRLVKKTVNQDDPTVYHLFYADENGSPGADLTFFEYPGAAPGRAGAGMVHTVVWRVGSGEALDFWSARLGVERDGDTVRFADHEGLRHELVIADVADDPLVADHPEIPRELALQGFEGARAFAGDVELRTARFLEQLGFERHAERWTTRGDSRGGWIEYEPAPEGPAFPGRAPSTTSRGPRRWRITSPGSSGWQRRAAGRRRWSTGSGSARSTSASRAACCTRSPRSDPASRPTRTSSTSAKR